MDEYIGTVRIFAGNFAPVGWLFCQGQLLPISEYETLFVLIGTTYGGDGQSTFALPDLRSRLPLHMGNGYTIGGQTGTENVTLTPSQIPAHTHALVASAGPAPAVPVTAPTGQWLGQPAVGDLYVGAGRRPTTLSPQAVTVGGGSQPHTNIPPVLALNFIICWSGRFPPQS
ncbi:phage tail protein [Deinococcus sp. QL22]|uniref:phage tail protein n=1 Tax=Deinococcus sp. QL22 TaxID=2939437 RepID=UPI002018273A|nr:tail fiber protein [Deinococcus sp. QL22]UQN09592.1 tail fiber protein [Deinococcus sp. QL22]